MARQSKKKGKGSNKENQPPRKAANRPAKLHIWSNESMLKAMDAVKQGTMGVNRAALEHSVPRTTLDPLENLHLE